MAEQILNATAPRDVWPLLHEGKLIGLDKLSGQNKTRAAHRQPDIGVLLWCNRNCQ